MAKMAIEYRKERIAKIIAQTRESYIPPEIHNHLNFPLQKKEELNEQLFHKLAFKKRINETNKRSLELKKEMLVKYTEHKLNQDRLLQQDEIGTPRKLIRNILNKTEDPNDTIMP